MEMLPEFLREYRGHRLVIKADSELTVEQYLLDITLFLKWLVISRSGKKPTAELLSKTDIGGLDVSIIASVTRSDILEFLVYAANDRNNGSKARARKLSSLKSLFKYLTVTTRQLKNNPAADIETPKVRPALPKYLELEESIKLLDTVKNDISSATRERDYAIITLFLNCGMRLSELCGINLSDTDSELKSLRVLGKGSKQRIIYLNDACRSALRAWLAVRAKDNQIKADSRDAMFISSRHSRISNKTVQWMVNRYLELAGLGNRNFSVHKLRHTAATLMYREGGVDVRVLKDILGHEQLNTTQIYTHVSNEQMEKAISSNPLSDIKAAKPGALKVPDESETEAGKEKV
ncbi:MAG: tyrosine-type recombinase/integrase [Clostridiales bacterium]|jgi:site-specific recombinase XerD|nr:tyrosine-type recombinase/integrase [Clostridiales bacterium]